MMLGRSRRAITASSSAASSIIRSAPTTSRFAHAARLPEEDTQPQPQAGPSASRIPSRPSLKGKERASEYRFPEKGRSGGPPTPYEVLGLERSATDSEIKQTYYRLAMILHPDSSHPSSSPEHFATLARAYALLSQPQSRQAYLQTGYGWSATGHVTKDSWSDARMRSEVHARRRGGAASWEAGSRGYRSHEPGASGGWAYQQEQWQYGDEFATPPKGNGEALYMSNRRFVSIFMGISGFVAWVQYQRVGIASETHRELLQAQHISASQALAEARGDAARYGKERRERIRRRVRETEVLNEVEKLHNGESGIDSSHQQ